MQPNSFPLVETIAGLVVFLIGGAVTWLFKSNLQTQARLTEHDATLERLVDHQACAMVTNLAQQMAVLQVKSEQWDHAVHKIDRIHDTVLRIETKLEMES